MVLELGGKKVIAVHPGCAGQGREWSTREFGDCYVVINHKTDLDQRCCVTGVTSEACALSGLHGGKEVSLLWKELQLTEIT